jgi:secreted PhoX family phosphatase
MHDDDFSNKAEAFEAFDDIPRSPAEDDTIGAVIGRRYNRRDVLKGALGVAAATALFGTSALNCADPARAATTGFTFPELANGIDATHHVADGYEADILIRWGDPLTEGLPAFDPAKLTGHARAALRQPRVHQPRGDVSGHQRPAGPQ